MRKTKYPTGHVDPGPGKHSYAVRLRAVRQPGMTLVEAFNIPRIADEVLAAALEKNNIRRRRILPPQGPNGEP